MTFRTFTVGRTFWPTNGAPVRQITDMQVAGLRDHPYRPGTMLVSWATSAGEWGRCTERSFRDWVRRTKARPQPMQGERTD